jgi:hypothetical protein
MIHHELRYHDLFVVCSLVSSIFEKWAICANIWERVERSVVRTMVHGVISQQSINIYMIDSPGQGRSHMLCERALERWCILHQEGQ